MSVSRTSDAIPKITARQMATASLEVPKSIRKTIVGRDGEADGAPASASFWEGAWEHAAPKIRRASVGTADKRGHEIIDLSKKVETVKLRNAPPETDEYT